MHINNEIAKQNVIPKINLDLIYLFYLLSKIPRSLSQVKACTIFKFSLSCLYKTTIILRHTYPCHPIEVRHLVFGSPMLSPLASRLRSRRLTQTCSRHQITCLRSRRSAGRPTGYGSADGPEERLNSERLISLFFPFSAL